MAIKIGVISDTHGLLRPAVLEALKSCDYILHGRIEAACCWNEQATEGKESLKDLEVNGIRLRKRYHSTFFPPKKSAEPLLQNETPQI